jgi:DNA-binding transcriptional LysR family regulator
MDIRKLQHVTTLAREAHFGRAADRLGLTQSALTRSVQATEAELDLRLFDRGRDGVRLTRAGERFVEEAQAVLRQMDHLERNMALLTDRAIGEVYCGFGPMAATLVLEPVLARIARDHATLRMRTRLGDVVDLLARLQEGDLDFALLALPLVEDRPGLTLRRIARVRIGGLVRRGHPLAGRRVTDEETAGFPILGGTGPAPDPTGRYATTIACDNFEIAKAVALASDAIWVTAEAMADDRFAVLDGPSIVQHSDIAVASLARRTLSPAALLVIDLIAQAAPR